MHEKSASQQKVFKSVVCMGQQPGSEVFVLGPNLPFKSNGAHIASEEQEFIGIPEIISKNVSP